MLIFKLVKQALMNQRIRFHLAQGGIFYNLDRMMKQYGYLTDWILDIMGHCELI